MEKVIAVGSDHGGFELKEEIRRYLEENGWTVEDFGTYSTESVNYAEYAKKPCAAVQEGKCRYAILFCGTGVGISIAANKHRGIRACCCTDAFSVQMSRRHNDANVLCLGGRVLGSGAAKMLVDIFLAEEFEGGGRHSERVATIASIEREQASCSQQP